MTCNVISTGSQGNAVILGTEILIDCGVPYKLLAPHVQALRLVLLTHEHGDHFNPATVRRLHRERPTLRFGCCEWMVPHLVKAGISPRVIDVYTASTSNIFNEYDGGRVIICAFPLIHDVENCGYKIAIGEKTALYATDTFTMDEVTAPGFDLYMIEANHTQADIEERIRKKTEAGEFVYEHRAAAGHLSKEKADSWLAMNATPGKSKVIYLHQHHDTTKEEYKTQ